MNNSPIFLLGPHKSGTSLLRSLFDGNYGLFVVPIETHVFPLLNRWVTYPYRYQLPLKDEDHDFRTACCKWIKYSNKNKDNKSDSLTINWFNEKIFSNTLKAELENAKNIKDYINGYYKAIYLSLGNEEKEYIKLRILEKSVENAEFAIELSKIYPDAKFVHIIRNPYSNLVSLRKYKGEKEYPYIDLLIKTLNNSYLNLYRNEKIIDNYRIVKYEDLVSDVHGEMIKLADFLGLSFKENLTIPTVNNKRWKGNSTSGKEFKGVSNKRLEKWKNQIYDNEIAAVNKYFPHILDRFKYEKIKNPNKIISKNPQETLKKIVVNKIFLARKDFTL